MASLRRKFSTEQKMHILQQAEELGVIKVINQHRLSYSVFARWKHQLAPVMAYQHEDMLQTQKEKEQLERENVRLRNIVANQALELELLNETLKKTNMLSIMPHKFHS